MTFVPITPATATTAAAPATVAGRAATTAADRASGSVDAVTVDTFPSSPPPEVLSAMATAAHAWDRLVASGHQLHFEPSDGRVTVQLTDLQGNVLRTISPSTALTVADGGSLS